jgi:hypothetical protein
MLTRIDCHSKSKSHKKAEHYHTSHSVRIAAPFFASSAAAPAAAFHRAAAGPHDSEGGRRQPVRYPVPVNDQSFLSQMLSALPQHLFQLLWPVGLYFIMIVRVSRGGRGPDSDSDSDRDGHRWSESRSPAVTVTVLLVVHWHDSDSPSRRRRSSSLSLGDGHGCQCHGFRVTQPEPSSRPGLLSARLGPPTLGPLQSHGGLLFPPSFPEAPSRSPSGFLSRAGSCHACPWQ